jgi:hypothetical protein
MAEERGRDVHIQKIPTLKHSLVPLLRVDNEEAMKEDVKPFIPGLCFVAQASGEQKA